MVGKRNAASRKPAAMNADETVIGAPCMWRTRPSNPTASESAIARMSIVFPTPTA